MKNVFFLVFIGCGLSFYACEETVLPLSRTISMTTQCGWCQNPRDSVFITLATTSYDKNLVCRGDSSSIKNVSTNLQQWKAINDALDMNTFKQLDMNTCAICYDGCDTTLTITQGNDTHTIRFAYSDSAKMVGIRPLISEINALKASL